MILKKFFPSLQLQPYIKCYYLCESDYTEYVQDVFSPMAVWKLFFTWEWIFTGVKKKECRAKILGQITQPLTMKAKGKGKSFGIWFLPHTFSLFSDIPVNELNDKAIALENIFSRTFIDFVENSLFENDIAKLMQGVNSYLLKTLKTSNPFKENIASYAIQFIINEKEEASLDKLVKDCNISSRYLQKIFLEKVGVGPKFFMRIVRFQKTLGCLAAPRTNSLTALTYESGYFDQGHFIKEFKEFTGIVPSHFQPASHPINQHFLSF